MSLFKRAEEEKTESKIGSSQYIRTENTSNEADTKPADPVKPTQPEAK